ncbi:hypothetical protein [Streptomyces lavendofoliae]|uniref:Uncharacterized protein n=1 Tax=Streptomyces lavendofoliae TaxID=67314 RepID=A0A918M7S6_9ACTN|nr:hypothetical protein [Streptomyces lavendofoliae]GGU61175.1 hypothetical protein GCM10010274_57510 [Streptomyces lavendofoliae]
MSYTVRDVREVRTLMNVGRDNRLAIGDRLLAIAPPGNDACLSDFCNEVDLSIQTARDYRHTALACPPEIRRLIADSGVHVSYSVVREGARAGVSGAPRDAGWSVLQALIEEAQNDGTGCVLRARYMKELGITPPQQGQLPGSADLLDEATLEAIRQDPELLLPLVQDAIRNHEGAADAVRQAVEEDRRARASRRNDPTVRTGNDTSLRFVRDLLNLRDQGTGFMNRYPHSISLPDDQKDLAAAACEGLSVLLTWVREKASLGDQAVPRQTKRRTTRVPAATR